MECFEPGILAPHTIHWGGYGPDHDNIDSNLQKVEYDDIANAAWYLGSSESRNTTGVELTVDGGNMIQLYPIIPHSES